MRTKVPAFCLSLLLGAATAAFGGRLSFQEHAAMMDSLSRVHPRARARWLKERGIDDLCHMTFYRSENAGLDFGHSQFRMSSRL